VSIYLGQLTTEAVKAVFAASPVAVLLPVGSVEPHGPHLPLETDTIISTAACERAVARLAERHIVACIAPSIPYGVTDFAAGFAGAVSLSAAAVTAFAGAVTDALLAAGAAHVCLVNNHLEPAQDAAIRAVLAGKKPGTVSVACPLTRRWARTLSAEFKSGACHAGRYETSLVLAARPELVDDTARSDLPEVPTSLSEGIKAGRLTFAAMGMDRAYAGAPADGTADEGREQLELLAQMIEGEVSESYSAAGIRL
jgi:creatinine amidohydrolase